MQENFNLTTFTCSEDRKTQQVRITSVRYASVFLNFRLCFQTFYLSNDNHLRQEEECAVANGTNVIMVPCGGEKLDTWEYKDYHFININNGKCLTIDGDEANSEEPNMKLQGCSSSDAQIWIIYRKTVEREPRHLNPVSNGSDRSISLGRNSFLSFVLILLSAYCNIY